MGSGLRADPHPVYIFKDYFMKNNVENFIELCIENQVLRFGEFTLKSGRISPYFFNAGLFHSGVALQQLGRFYADAIIESGVEFDVLFGPAYKGIPLATATGIALAEHYQRDIPVTFNRKEAKDHGEGGVLIGAPLQGKILVIDDVITAGTAFRQSQQLIAEAGAEVCGVVIAMNRQERGLGGKSALEEISDEFSIPVVSIIQLDDIISYLHQQADTQFLAAIEKYREEFGVEL